jgi:hypothetical protein
MAITGIGGGSIWLNSWSLGSSGSADGLSGSGGGGLSDLFGLGQPVAPGGGSGDAALLGLFAVPGQVAEANTRLADLFAAGAEGTADATSLLDWLGQLGAGTQSSLLGTGSAGSTPIIGWPTSPDASAASTDILYAFFDPQNEFIGDVLDALG